MQAARMINRCNQRTTWLQGLLLKLVTFAIPLLIASKVMAHPVPPARAILDLQPSGRCELRITCDASALVMQTMPGHLGQAAEELKAMSTDELQARVDDTQGSLVHYLQLRFDGVRQKLPHIQMPSLQVICSGAAHGGEEAWPAIVLQGDWPIGAKTCEITFPAALGRVQFQLIRSGKEVFSRELAAGSSSGLITLQAGFVTPSSSWQGNWIGWAMVALLLVYLVRVYIGRPRYDSQHYSRSTNTGQ